MEKCLDGFGCCWCWRHPSPQTSTTSWVNANYSIFKSAKYIKEIVQTRDFKLWLLRCILRHELILSLHQKKRKENIDNL